MQVSQTHSCHKAVDFIYCLILKVKRGIPLRPSLLSSLRICIFIFIIYVIFMAVYGVGCGSFDDLWLIIDRKASCSEDEAVAVDEVLWIEGCGKLRTQPRHVVLHVRGSQSHPIECLNQVYIPIWVADRNRQCLTLASFGELYKFINLTSAQNGFVYQCQYLF